MGMIRVSDEIEERLKQIANGRTMTKTVASLLDGTPSDPISTPDSPSNVAARLDKMAQYLKERFDKLEKSIADTTVDRLERSSDNGRAVKKTNKEGGVAWEQMQYLIYTMDENSSEWLMSPSEVEALKEGEPADFTYYIEDDIIYRKDSMKSYPLMMVSPWVKQVLEEGRVYE